MEQKSKACNNMLYDPDVEELLETEKNNQKAIIDDIAQRLAQEKQSIAELLINISSEDVVKTKLAEANNRVTVKKQEYDIAEKNYNEAIQLQEAQKSYISSLEGELPVLQNKLANAGSDTSPPANAAQLAGHGNPIKAHVGDCLWRLSPNHWYDQGCLDRKENLKTKVQTQEQSLAQARKDLNNKESDKVTKEAVKNQISIELQNEVTSKNQAENELKALQENQVKIQTTQSELDTANQAFSDAQQMLELLHVYTNEETIDLGNEEGVTVAAITTEWAEL